MRLLVNLLFLVGFVGAFTGVGYWAHTRFVTGGVLIEAAAKGTIPDAERAIDAGADVDGDGLEGHNAMVAAIRHGHLPMVRFLLDQGATLNRRSMDSTPLAWAAIYGRREIYDYLESRGGKLLVSPIGYDHLKSHMRNNNGRALLAAVEEQYKREASMERRDGKKSRRDGR